MKIETMRVAALTPYARNARTHSPSQVDQIARSIAEFGFTNPVLIDADGGIIAGHGRVLAAQQLAMEAVPCIRLVHLTPEQRRAYVIADNATALNAEWDIDMLTAEVEAILADIQLGTLPDSIEDIFNFDFLRVDGLEEGLTDPDAIPDPPAEPITQRGDLWLLGDHRVLCGDSTVAEDVARLMGGERAICMWTDPPYGVSIVGGNRQRSEAQRKADRPESATIAGDTAVEVPGLLFGAFALAAQSMAPGSPWYCARPPGEHSFLFADAIRRLGWKLHEELQWVKGHFALGHSDYHIQHETIMYGWTPSEAGRSGRGNHDGSRWYGDNAQSSVFETEGLAASPDHPSMKPVALVECHVRNSTPPGGIVYDPFLGSGTTLIACGQLGRRCYGIEIEPRYVDVIVRRWEEFTGHTATREQLS